MFFDGIVFLIFVVVVVGAVIVFLVRILFFGALLGAAIRTHRQAFEQAMRQQEALLGRVGQAGGQQRQLLEQQLLTAFLQASQASANFNLSDRQFAEERMSSMKADASAAGIDVSSWN